MMLAARTQDLWLPGKAPASSPRAEQIARSREELMKLLADLPEPEHHELSFTDLVEKVSPVAGESGRSTRSWEEEEEAAKQAAKEIAKSNRRDWERIRPSESSLSRRHGGGTRNVLLNVYVPPHALTSGFAAPRSRRGSRESTPRSAKREKTESTFKVETAVVQCCFPSIWAKGKAKPAIKQEDCN